MARGTGWVLAAAVSVVVGAGCMQQGDPGDATIERVLTAEPEPAEREDDGPQRYGDDPRLDSMQDDCERGELRACDLLYMETTEGTGYEHVALTSGGTTAVSDTFCTPEPELDESGYAPADSPGLEVLASDCKDGDLTACDLLYLLVPEGHPFEDVGITCGGRVAEGAYPDCRTELG